MVCNSQLHQSVFSSRKDFDWTNTIPYDWGDLPVVDIIVPNMCYSHTQTPNYKILELQYEKCECPHWQKSMLYSGMLHFLINIRVLDTTLNIQQGRCVCGIGAVAITKETKFTKGWSYITFVSSIGMFSSYYIQHSEADEGMITTFICIIFTILTMQIYSIVWLTPRGLLYYKWWCRPPLVLSSLMTQ